MFMKTKHLIIAGMALLSFAACDKETGDVDPIFKGDKAYINVQLAYADPQTRGTGDSTNPFYYGTAEENKVNNAHFFFYTANGTFAEYANETLDWKANGVDIPTTGNVEKISGGVVVLKNLKSTNYPTYMSVLLNANGSMVEDLKGKSIKEAQDYIINEIATASGNSQIDWSNFVMTSSTFKADKADAASGFFCVKLKASNFQDSEEAAKKSDNAVTAYVERLAAKVKVGFAETIKDNKGLIGSFVVDGKPVELYFHVDGWGLNGTTKDSYAFKNIDDAWSFGDFAWNDPANFRSYWAKSTVYGIEDGVFPGDAAGVLPGTTTTLNYISYNDLAVDIEKNAYCRENTNTVDNLERNFAGSVTSVLLKATVEDAEGKAFELVNYKKELYTPEHYVDTVLLGYKTSHPGANIIVCDGAAENKVYKDVDAEHTEIVSLGDGVVYVKLKALTAPAFYCTGDVDSKTFSEKITVDEANNLLNGTAADEKATSASYYKGGMMYYNIPIEHLRQGVKFNETGFKANIKNAEAVYGVVRNHYYMVTVNSIKNLGKAVYDPSEVIIPGDDDIKNYYVGAKINILSWKVVKQDVDL